MSLCFPCSKVIYVQRPTADDERLTGKTQDGRLKVTMTDRIDSEGALQTAYKQLERLHAMLERVVEQHRDDPRALRLQTLQITRLMEDIQAEIDEYLQRTRAATPPTAGTVQP